MRVVTRLSGKIIYEGCNMPLGKIIYEGCGTSIRKDNI